MTIEQRARRTPIFELLFLAGPTVAQMASYTLMQFVDTYMLSRVGTDEPTAAGNSGLLAFALICFGFGLLFVVNTLASQSYGAKRFGECGRHLWQGFYVAVSYSLLLLPTVGFADVFFRAFHHAHVLAAMEGGYFRITMSFMFAKLIGVAAGQFLLAVNRPLVVFGSAVAGISANALVAWALIFGHLGFAPHSIVGSAWGQNVGVCVETAFLLAAIFLKPVMRQSFGVLDARLRRRELLALLKIGAGAGMQVVADVMAWSLFGVWVIGRFGTQAMAANTFMVRYLAVSFMPAYGISVAVTALVGRSIGAGRPDEARRWARLGFLVAASYMVACGLVFLFGRHLLIGLFTRDPVIARTGALLLCFGAAYQLFDAFYIVFNGALRGAGDTLIPGLATGVFCWGITIFGGYAVARNFPRWGVAGPWTMEIIYGIVLGLFMWHRFSHGHWREIHLIAAYPPPCSAVPTT